MGGRENRRRRKNGRGWVDGKREFVVCVKGVRELDREVWQERGSLRRRKEAQASAVTVISLWITVIFSALFSALLFASIPTMPQLLLSKKATMTDDYSSRAAILFVRLLSGKFIPFITLNCLDWRPLIWSAPILTSIWTIIVVTKGFILHFINNTLLLTT